MNCYPFACDSPEFFSALAVIEVIKVRHEDEYRRDESKRFIFCEIVSSACHVFFFSLFGPISTFGSCVLLHKTNTVMLK